LFPGYRYESDPGRTGDLSLGISILWLKEAISAYKIVVSGIGVVGNLLAFSFLYEITYLQQAHSVLSEKHYPGRFNTIRKLKEALNNT